MLSLENKGLLSSVGLSRPELTVTQGHTIQLLYLEWTTCDTPTIGGSVHAGRQVREQVWEESVSAALAEDPCQITSDRYEGGRKMKLQC